MTFFKYQHGRLYGEQVELSKIANDFGTPSYVYSKAAFEKNWKALDEAFAGYPHLICYAVKANSNIAILNTLARLGSGFDIVSAGELQRVIAAGGDPQKTVFSGVAKSDAEIKFALECEAPQFRSQGIRCINVESLAEMQRIEGIAKKLKRVAAIGVRINPDVDARTHPYIATGLENSKFGLDIDTAISAYQYAQASRHLEVHSMACHIGSQITELQPFNDAVERVAKLVLKLLEQGIELQQLDLGGGLGIDYQGEALPSANQYVTTLINQVTSQGLELPIAIEPGRYIAGNSGVLLTTVEYLKETASKNFAVVDAGMNDLLRPSLYQAFHQIIPVIEDQNHEQQESSGTQKHWDVVGPVCESSDVLGTQRPMHLNQGDILAIRSAGAYAFTMASNYNSRPRPPELMIDGEQVHVIRKRESIEDLYAAESLLP